MHLENIDNLIRHYRQKQGMTQSELAIRLGTTTQSVSRLETGNMRLSTDWLARIGAALNIHPSQLLPSPETSPAIMLRYLSPKDGLLETGIGFDWPAINAKHCAVEIQHPIGEFAVGDILIAQDCPPDQRHQMLGKICILWSSSLAQAPIFGRLLNSDHQNNTAAIIDISHSRTLYEDAPIQRLACVQYSLKSID